MSNRTLSIDDRLYEYLLGTSVREPEVLRRLREETASQPLARMQIAPEQGQFMALLMQIAGVRRAIEVGTFTGYSALSMVLAMPDDGHMVCCDINEEWASVAQRYWAEAGVQDRIDLRLAPALDTLDELVEAAAGQFDFAFIDADKQNYTAYYDKCMQLVRSGGLIAIDNTLWSGAVADPANDEASTRAIRRFNDRLYHDDRINISLVPIGDGLTLAYKR